MADAADSKSAAREGVRVRVPLSALSTKFLEALEIRGSETFLYVSKIINHIIRI